jgi:hypothetical protein
MQQNKTTELLSEAELKFIRRLRGLHAGSHLIIIIINGEGVASLSILNSGKFERLQAEGRPPPSPSQSIQPGTTAL